MEQLPTDRYIAPTVSRPEEWEAALADPELATRFDELVTWTFATADPVENPWVQDPQEVAGRWQHAVEILGQVGATHSYPLLRGGWGWADKQYMEEQMSQIHFRNYEAPMVENALFLAHHLATKAEASDNPGLSINLNIANHAESANNPKYHDINIVRVDLRDMAEPTETVLGDLTLEDFQALDESQREALAEQLDASIKGFKWYGQNYGWISPPQHSRYFEEGRTYSSYRMLTEYGTDDDNEISRIRHERKAAEIAQLRQENPDFGKAPEGAKELPKSLRRCIGAMYAYFDQMRETYEDITIDTYSLGEMGVTNKQLQKLQEHGILEQEEGVIPSPAGPLWSFKLAQPYYEYWVAAHYPAPNDA